MRRVLRFCRFLVHRQSLIAAAICAHSLRPHSCTAAERPEVTELHSRIGRLVRERRAKQGQSEGLWPEITVKCAGGVYTLEFVVDQRKVDLFSAAIELLSREKNPENLRQLEALASGRVCSLRVPFGAPTDRGAFYLLGEFTESGPAFRVTMEKARPPSDEEVETLLRLYFACNKQVARNATHPATTLPNAAARGESEVVDELRKMGVVVHLPGASDAETKSWDDLGGYHSQKRQIEDTIFLSLQHPEVFDQITRATRRHFERNRAKAVLFEGPPGTGKTTMARIIAGQVGVPLLYLPLEAVLSKWFGESEQNLSRVFELAQRLGRTIVFIDEVDVLGMERGADIHEVSRKLVSTLLRKLDSFETARDVLLVCATNRKEALDAALLSRLDLSVRFDHPSVEERAEIYQQYAKHLVSEELRTLAHSSDGASGRAILESCREVERGWAARMVRGEVDSPLPPAELYEQSIRRRLLSRLN